jgi:phosphinothricin acetyltransferase
VELIACQHAYIPQIRDIFNEAILNSTALYDYHERTLETVTTWFENKQCNAYPVIGAVDAGGELLGFGTYGAFRAWPAYKYTVEHSIYVRQGHRGMGIGKALLQAIMTRAGEQGFHNIIGGIDSENMVSIRLHQKAGFILCGRIRHAGFKFNRWLDLEFHQLILPTPAQPVDG